MTRRALLFGSGALALTLIAGCERGRFDAEPTESLPIGGRDETLLSFFDGTTLSRGRLDQIASDPESFTARLTGTYRNARLKLREAFRFSDGQPLQIWDLSADRKGTISGTVSTQAEDGVMSQAFPVSGWATQDRLVLDYDGIAPGGGATRLHFHHSMTRQGDGTVENRVTISKFYHPLATSTVTFFKPK
ncbi:Protein of unknown function [Fulvimarina manganoxydans]|uniref:Uncharacterized protein n=1 Tax=Fulvimarina manganoxydans TaxID=937218 RepID=A0A1W2BE55_9HYPH|nr:DUF3833 family protein [Fulvimarina manganoxydans]SMC71002.1 Protein of unknown function [Fulvimarina manganoxydans]